MRFLLILVLCLLQACAHGRYQNGPVIIEVWSFGTDFDVNPASDVSDQFGNHSVKMKGLKTEQSKTVSEAAGKIMEAIVKGAAP